MLGTVAGSGSPPAGRFPAHTDSATQPLRPFTSTKYQLDDESNAITGKISSCKAISIGSKCVPLPARTLTEDSVTTHDGGGVGVVVFVGNGVDVSVALGMSDGVADGSTVCVDVVDATGSVVSAPMGTVVSASVGVEVICTLVASTMGVGVLSTVGVLLSSATEHPTKNSVITVSHKIR